MLDKIAAILAAVLVLVMLSSCGEPDDDAGPGDALPESTPTETVVPSATPVPTDTPLPTETSSPDPTEAERPGEDLPRPPDAVLAAGDAVQTGELGTYCWTGEDSGACVDMSGILVPDEVLEVEPGQQMAFSVPGFEALANVQVGAFDFADVESDDGDLVLMYPSEGELGIPVDLSGDEVVITADLPPGEYVISVFLGFPGDTSLPPGVDHQVSQVRGDASYGFHIRVAGD